MVGPGWALTHAVLGYGTGYRLSAKPRGLSPDKKLRKSARSLESETTCKSYSPESHSFPAHARRRAFWKM